MINNYFEAKWLLARMRASCVGPYIDAFSTALSNAGYAPFTIRGYLRAADHVGRWADGRQLNIQSWDDDTLMRFARHLPRCRCIEAAKGIRSNALGGVRLLFAHLRVSKVIAPALPASTTSRFALISEQFAAWMVRHRGVAPSTTARYQGVLKPFLAALGEDPSRYTVTSIRAYVIKQLGDVGRSETRTAVKAIRAFLRYHVAEGRVHSGIQLSIPTVPQWRLSSLPRYLEAVDVARVVTSCDLATGHGLRDHAGKRKLSLALCRWYAASSRIASADKAVHIGDAASAESFQDKTLWPEYQAFSEELDAHLEGADNACHSRSD